MQNKKLARKLTAAAGLIFLATLGIMLSRHFSLAPDRPAPDFRAFGPADAAIQIHEYTDFACPACKAASAHLKELLQIYKGSVRLHFKHYPLSSIHPWSLQAAAYADCAGQQGKFLEYADLLFKDQEAWAFAKEKPKEFLKYAAKLKLDRPAFEKCSADEATLKRIKLDIAEADTRGVNSTPTFFVNGKRTVGSGQLLEQAKRFDAMLKNRAKI